MARDRDDWNNAPKWGHYADDEEPDDYSPPVVRSGGRAVSVEEFQPDHAPAAAPPSSTAGEVLVSVHLAKDWLPETIKLDKAWQRSVDPDDYGTSVLDACRLEQWRLTLGAVETVEGDWSRLGGFLPPVRQRLVALLDTRGYGEFDTVEKQYRSYGKFRGESLVLNKRDEPAIVIEASRSGVKDVFIDPGWASKAAVWEVQAEFLDCARELRRQLRAFTHTSVESRLSDEELMLCVQAHRDRLVRIAREQGY